MDIALNYQNMYFSVYFVYLDTNISIKFESVMKKLFCSLYFFFPILYSLSNTVSFLFLSLLQPLKHCLTRMRETDLDNLIHLHPKSMLLCNVKI